MAALPEDDQSDSGRDETGFPTPLYVAAKRFDFDAKDRRNRQPGVERLQQWLNEQGIRIPVDGHLGPATIAAIARAYSTEKYTDLDLDETADFRQAGAQPEPTPDISPESVRPPATGETSVHTCALSDSAITDLSQDRLSFRPYVEAVAEFILAEQTRPPLAIAINARWGQGKTSFMNMLDVQLRQRAPDTTTRVATTWFNPWKYSEPEQVWAAFVANVTRCLRSNLTREQSWSFRWDRFREKLRRHGDLSFWLRVIVAAMFLSIVASLAFMDWVQIRNALLEDQKLLKAFYAAASADTSGYLWYLPVILCVPLAILLAYVALTNKLGLNLLDYVEKTDFKDKIGTLSQFEHEMRRLADAVPDDLKVVVFIDDLDRCKGKVLGEIIEALQLADVSRACIFVMGMDLQIVAEAIERERAELAHAAGRAHQMEHGSGYKFLEKIIQARLSLPAHDAAQMEALVKAAMNREDEPAESQAEPEGQGLGDRLRKRIGLTPRSERKTPSDSDIVIEKAQHYGSHHFSNPRRLKRFINGFRLQTYLAAATRPDMGSIDRLARFLVLAEKWPAVVDYMLQNNLGSRDMAGDASEDSTSSLRRDIAHLKEDEKRKLYDLLDGPDRKDPASAEDWQNLADWCGFIYYRGVESNGEQKKA